jgi:hypothetical protein
MHIHGGEGGGSAQALRLTKLPNARLTHILHWPMPRLTRQRHESRSE